MNFTKLAVLLTKYHKSMNPDTNCFVDERKAYHLANDVLYYKQAEQGAIAATEMLSVFLRDDYDGANQLARKLREAVDGSKLK